MAHQALAVAAVGSSEHTHARQAFDQALTTIDTTRRQQARIYSLHPAAKKVLATLDREWDGLARHQHYPDLPLDNNPAERALRTPVVGRKNYYGSHATWSAHLAARIWTITATAQRNHREPLALLTEYLTACATAGGTAPQGPALDHFLPWIPTDTPTSGDPDRLIRPDPATPTGPHPKTRPRHHPEPNTAHDRPYSGRPLSMSSHRTTEYLPPRSDRKPPTSRRQHR